MVEGTDSINPFDYEFPDDDLLELISDTTKAGEAGRSPVETKAAPPAVEAPVSVEQQIETLDEDLEYGIITPEEYAEERAALMVEAVDPVETSAAATPTAETPAAATPAAETPAAATPAAETPAAETPMRAAPDSPISVKSNTEMNGVGEQERLLKKIDEARKQHEEHQALLTVKRQEAEKVSGEIQPLVDSLATKYATIEDKFTTCKHPIAASITAAIAKEWISKYILHLATQYGKGQLSSVISDGGLCVAWGFDQVAEFDQAPLPRLLSRSTLCPPLFRVEIFNGTEWKGDFNLKKHLWDFEDDVVTLDHYAGASTSDDDYVMLACIVQTGIEEKENGLRSGTGEHYYSLILKRYSSSSSAVDENLLTLYHADTLAAESGPLFKEVTTEMWRQLKGSPRAKLWIRRDLVRQLLPAAGKETQFELSAKLSWIGEDGGTCAVDAVITALAGVEWDYVTNYLCLNIMSGKILCNAQSIIWKIMSNQLGEARDELCDFAKEFWDDLTQKASMSDAKFCQRNAGETMHFLLRGFSGIDSRKSYDRVGIFNKYDLLMMLFATLLSMVCPLESQSHPFKDTQNKHQARLLTKV